MIPHSDLIRSTDPYGKPAYKIMHRGDIEQMAEDLREHLSIEMLEKPLNFDPFGHAELSLFAKI